VLPENAGKAHTRLVFKQQLTAAKNLQTYIQSRKFDGQPLTLLSEVMKSAPRFDRPGGFRGGDNGYERGVKVGVLWLTKEAAEALRQKLGDRPGHREKMKYLSRLILEDQAVATFLELGK
jgi:hypothetical protein